MTGPRHDGSHPAVPLTFRGVEELGSPHGSYWICHLSMKEIPVLVWVTVFLWSCRYSKYQVLKP